MASKTNALENLATDFFLRGQGFTAGGQTVAAAAFSWRIGLLNVSLRNNSQAVALNAFIILNDSGGAPHLLKCTTAGTTAASAPNVAIANNATVTDGTVTWTDQYAALEAATVANLNGTVLPVEFSGGSYARQTLTASLANMSGTHGGGTTTASTGTGSTTSNNAQISFNAGSGGNAGLFFITDAAAANIYWWGYITGAPVPLASGATANFAAGALTFQEDN